jgi:hypothetical protein
MAKDLVTPALSPFPSQSSDLPQLYSQQLSKEGHSAINRSVNDLDRSRLQLNCAEMMAAETQRGDLNITLAESLKGNLPGGLHNFTVGCNRDRDGWHPRPPSVEFVNYQQLIHRQTGVTFAAAGNPPE